MHNQKTITNDEPIEPGEGDLFWISEEETYHYKNGHWERDIKKNHPLIPVYKWSLKDSESNNS